MENTSLIPNLKNQSTWKLFFLSVLTLGIYTAHYIKHQSNILNDFLPESQRISKAFIGFFLIYSYLTVALLIPYFFVEEGHPIEIVSDFGDKIWNVLHLILAFKFRNRMNSQLNVTSGHSNWFSGVATFFFGFLYINFKINKLNEMIPNQKLDPTVTTPVESGNEQGTAGHP